jgi:hypothetical protein
MVLTIVVSPSAEQPDWSKKSRRLGLRRSSVFLRKMFMVETGLERFGGAGNDEWRIQNDE